jgi:hypothetical protein
LIADKGRAWGLFLSKGKIEQRKMERKKSENRKEHDTHDGQRRSESWTNGSRALRAGNKRGLIILRYPKEGWT